MLEGWSLGFVACALLYVIMVKQCEAKVWALLVAGSKGFINYRHQSDVCHMYHVLHRNGIPDENIIVMMNDDVAQHSLNKYKGKLYNEPTGHDVYKGVPKDYTGLEINTRNFFNVLRGRHDRMRNVGSGKVINSTKDDHIFLYYSDHGGPGVVAMVNDIMFAHDLNRNLDAMIRRRKFSGMMMLIEACHSGSLFHSLLKSDAPVFVVTASSPYENSYPIYYHTLLRTYLGDEFSSYAAYLLTHRYDLSLHRLYEKLQSWVKGSTVHQYGNPKFKEHKLNDYIGGRMQSSNSVENDVANTAILQKLNSEQLSPRLSSVDIPLDILTKEINESASAIEKIRKRKQLKRILRDRMLANSVMKSIISNITNNDKQKMKQISSINYEINRNNALCAKRVTKTFSDFCFNIVENPYVINILDKLVATCNVQWTNQVSTRKIIRKVCSTHGKTTNNFII